MEHAELARIAESTTEVRVLRGDVVFRRGDPCMGFHCVVYGQVKLAFVSPNGDEKVVELIGPGHSFGEALMFMEKPYIVTAQALADSLLLHVDKAAVFDELEHNPTFARKMLAGMSRRLHGLMSDLEANSLRSGTQRVIGYLLNSAHDGERQEFTMEAAKVVIASRLSLTPEHFSRILHDLAHRGLIGISGRKITVFDAENLRSFHP
jgi:CRP-like cAMP-binding protein